MLRTLTGRPARQTAAEGVLVADDLTPAEAAGLDPALVHRGRAGARQPDVACGDPGAGSWHPHGRGRRPRTCSALAEGTTVVLDGRTGELHVDPAPEVLDEFSTRAATLARADEPAARAAEQPAVSRDGTDLTVAANVGSVADARAAAAAGADGAGLVRTEFLFLGPDDAPTVEEQQADYVAIAEAMGGRRVTLRTLDVGGDKPLPYLPMPVEANPFLGSAASGSASTSRSSERPAEGDLRGRAALPGQCHVPDGLDGRRADRGSSGADRRGRPGRPPDGLRVGMMVEVPAAALKIETFLPHLDFVSIGTNDLTQYALAAERGNGAVAACPTPWTRASCG